MLEIASGSGAHAAYLAAAMPNLEFQPTDLSSDARSSIDAWCADLPNVRSALPLDAASIWPFTAADAVLCINMIHIAPWAAAVGLVQGAARILPQGGPLVLYGPFIREGWLTAPSNLDFDASLRARDAEWGIRDLGAVSALAAEAGFSVPAIVVMPANNLLVTFRMGTPRSEPKGGGSGLSHVERDDFDAARCA